VTDVAAAKHEVEEVLCGFEHGAVGLEGGPADAVGTAGYGDFI
jgi:hypothetical protein